MHATHIHKVRQIEKYIFSYHHQINKVISLKIVIVFLAFITLQIHQYVPKCNFVLRQKFYITLMK